MVTEYDRGRAAGLAEAVKVVDAICNNDGITLPSNCTCRYSDSQGLTCSKATARNLHSEIVAALRALSTSPGEHVLAASNAYCDKCGKWHPVKFDCAMLSAKE